MIDELDIPPAPRRFFCRCGAEYAPVHYPRLGIPVAPKLNPCERCAPKRSDKEHLADVLRSRLRGASIPPALWGWSLDDVTVQRPTEADDAFVRRTLEAEPVKMGVARANLAGVASLQLYAEKLLAGRARGWMLITGLPGRGKSVALAALAAAVLRPVKDEMVELPARMQTHIRTPAAMAYARSRGLDRALHRPKPPPEILYVPVTQLGRSEGESWEADSRMVREAKRAPVLLLDELGTDSDPQKWEARAVEELLREREHRPTVLVSNRSHRELVDGALYGARVASRLEAGEHVCMGGPSWREA